MGSCSQEQRGLQEKGGGKREVLFGNIKFLISFRTSPEVIGNQFCNLTTLVKYLKLDGENCATAIIYVQRRGAISILKHFSNLSSDSHVFSIHVNQITPPKV